MADIPEEMSVKRRKTILKAGRFAPNCFGSSFLHEAGSVDCGSCNHFAGCRTAVSNEKPRRGAEAKMRRDYFKPEEYGPKERAHQDAMRHLLRGHHLRAFRAAQSHKRAMDAAYQHARRANSSLDEGIARAAKKLAAALVFAGHKMRKDKLWQQIGSRQSKIVNYWTARQYARLLDSPNPSDAQVAKSFEALTAEKFSRNQARSYRLLLEKLRLSARKHHLSMPA
jgi:hypothetical protein